MIKVIAWDIPGGENRKVLAEVESIQVTSADVRDNNGNHIMHYYAPDATWFDADGNGWYDWTVEAS